MKLLVFHIGADRYGLRLRDVVRVLPLLELKHLPSMDSAARSRSVLVNSTQ